MRSWRGSLHNGPSAALRQSALFRSGCISRWGHGVGCAAVPRGARPLRSGSFARAHHRAISSLAGNESPPIRRPEGHPGESFDSPGENSFCRGDHACLCGAGALGLQAYLEATTVGCASSPRRMRKPWRPLRCRSCSKLRTDRPGDLLLLQRRPGAIRRAPVDEAQLPATAIPSLADMRAGPARAACAARRSGSRARLRPVPEARIYARIIILADGSIWRWQRSFLLGQRLTRLRPASSGAW